MRIQRDCTLKSTSNNDKRLQYVLGHKGKLHINNGQPMVFVVGDAEAQCKLTTVQSTSSICTDTHIYPPQLLFL